MSASSVKFAILATAVVAHSKVSPDVCDTDVVLHRVHDLLGELIILHSSLE